MHESHLLVLQEVKISNNKRELANKVEEENDIMRKIVGDSAGDGGDAVGNYVDTDLRFETRYVCVARWTRFCHLASAYRAHFVR